MNQHSEFVEVRQTIERYKGDFGWQTQVTTVLEDRSEDLSEEFLNDLFNDYGIELPDPVPSALLSELRRRKNAE